MPFPMRQKSLLNKKSKSDMTDKKMFKFRSKGSHGRDVKIGKKSNSGKDTMNSGSISPSVDEFDAFLKKNSGSSSSDNKKKKLFGRK